VAIFSQIPVGATFKAPTHDGVARVFKKIGEADYGPARKANAERIKNGEQFFFEASAEVTRIHGTRRRHSRLDGDAVLKDFLCTVRSALLMICKWIEKQYGLKEAK
jgi:hypothetical protein